MRKSPRQMALELSQEDFEFLLRAYVERYIDGQQSIFRTVSFVASAFRDDETTYEWQISSGWDSKAGTTKGEILVECLDEHLRRSGFKSTLRLLEAPAVEEEKRW